MRLVEKYRPKTLDQIVGQDQAVAYLRARIKQGIGGRVFLFTGPSGVGKTTTALALGRELGIIQPNETFQAIQKGCNLDMNFWKGRHMDQRAADELAAWEIYYPVRAAIKMALIDEAQNITEGGRENLLSVFEGLSEHIVIVMTTTGLKPTQGEFDLFPRTSPFGSRCKHVNFVEPPTEVIVDYLVEVAFKECGKGARVPYKEIIREGKGNLRACLDLLQDALVERR